MDPILTQLINEERIRQTKSLNLIASENYTTVTTRNSIASVFMNKYAEGRPGSRCYPGIDICDKLENYVIELCREVFGVPQEWFSTAQALSGGPANLALVTSLFKPNSKILMLNEKDGGHFTHGGNKSLLSQLYQVDTYRTSENGSFSYENIQAKIESYDPDLIIFGSSICYEDFDYERIRKMTKAHLHLDMSHISGFVASKLFASPFQFVDSVTTTTHKTLRGPRGALLFSKKDFFDGVFPGIQAGPHMEIIGGIAQCLFETKGQNFLNYMNQTQKNAFAFGEEFMKIGMKIQTGQTKTHMVVVNVDDGVAAENILSEFGLFVSSAWFRGFDDKKRGIRVGTPMLTSLGLKENDFREIARIIKDILAKADTAQIKDRINTLVDKLVAE